MFQDQHRGRNTQGLRVEVWLESVGSSIFPTRPQDTETMQGAMVRMAGSGYSKDRMVETGRREIASPCEVDAHTMEDDRAHSWKDCNAMSREISKVAG